MRRLLVAAVLVAALLLLVEANRRPASVLPAPGDETRVARELLERPASPWLDGLRAAAEAAGVDPCLAGAVLAVEAAEVSSLERSAERLVVGAGRRLAFLHRYDLSLGQAQMKVSTAAWVASGFRDARPAEQLDDEQWRRTTSQLLGAEGRELFLAYLGYLQKRRGLAASCCRAGTPAVAPAAYVELGTEYNAGPRATGSPESAYGRLVAALATDAELVERVCRASPDDPVNRGPGAP